MKFDERPLWHGSDTDIRLFQSDIVFLWSLLTITEELPPQASGYLVGGLSYSLGDFYLLSAWVY